MKPGVSRNETGGYITTNSKSSEVQLFASIELQKCVLVKVLVTRLHEVGL